MGKLSDPEFDKVVAELQKTPIGAAIVKDYMPVLASADVDALPSADNAFVVSVAQRTGADGKAFTRIDVRGPDGLIHTAYEQDHVIFGRYLSVEEAISRGGDIQPDDLVMLTADEIAARMKPLLHQDHVIDGLVLAADDLGQLAQFAKQKVDGSTP